MPTHATKILVPAGALGIPYDRPALAKDSRPVRT